MNLLQSDRFIRDLRPFCFPLDPGLARDNSAAAPPFEFNIVVFPRRGPDNRLVVWTVFDPRGPRTRPAGILPTGVLAEDFLIEDFLTEDFLTARVLPADFVGGDFVTADFVGGDFLPADFLGARVSARGVLARDVLAPGALAPGALAPGALAPGAFAAAARLWDADFWFACFSMTFPARFTDRTPADRLDRVFEVELFRDLATREFSLNQEITVTLSGSISTTQTLCTFDFTTPR